MNTNYLQVRYLKTMARYYQFCFSKTRNLIFYHNFFFRLWSSCNVLGQVRNRWFFQQITFSCTFKCIRYHVMQITNILFLLDWFCWPVLCNFWKLDVVTLFTFLCCSMFQINMEKICYGTAFSVITVCDDGSDCSCVYHLQG